MTKQRLRLDSGAVFLRLALCFFVVREAFVWLVWMRPGRGRPLQRILFFVLRKWGTPHSVLYALLFATVATSLLELLVRLIVAPLVQRWHTPWTDESAGLFHVAANERVLGSSPARRAAGRQWEAGTLVQTNLRLWFFPRAHDAEIWSRPLDALREIRLEPAPRVAWGYVLGWPTRLKLGVAGSGGNGRPFDDVEDQRDHEVFAVPDPGAVLAWFEHSSASKPMPAPPISSPRRP